MHSLPQFDELWIVSDLHMGGAKSGTTNFQILDKGERLARFVGFLRELRPAEEVGLVLNGDIIDSLAEESLAGYVALDVEKAVALVDRIIGDRSFAPVWKALAEFVRTDRRHLVLVLGNHDIELALAPVEAYVRRHLAAGNVAANARITFATRGGGFACRVGAKRVFCTHGNEVDGWNAVDYDGLGLLENAMNAGRAVDPSRWKPNSGTRLVIDVMNAVKRRHPFVDLLKPEIKPVLGVLLTLDPGLLKRIDLGAAFPILREKLRGDRIVKNLLGAGVDLEDLPPPTLAAAVVDQVLGEQLAQQVRSASRSEEKEDQLLVSAGIAVTSRRPVADEIPSEGVETLGAGDIVAGWLGLVDRQEALRRALLDWLEDDKTFATDQRDPTFEAIVDRVGPGVDFVVTGHTHLARKIEWEPNRLYFNCGTWIRLLRLTRRALDSQTSFRKHVYEALAKGTMAALDEARIPIAGGAEAPLILDRANAVRIARDGPDVTAGAAAPGAPRPGVIGELLRVRDSADRQSVSFALEPREPQE